MKNWIIEQDSRITQTRVFAVRAETLEDAVDKVDRGDSVGVKEIRYKEYPEEGAPYIYDDSREAEEGEEDYFENLD